jgi:hypothetical protein
MGESNKSGSVEAVQFVEPSATRELLSARHWIGLGLALDWIAMRGQPMPLSEFNARHDLAASDLIDHLADMPTDMAEAMVRGVPENENGALKAVPAGIWRQTTAREDEFGDLPFFLIGTSDGPGGEWEGTIAGREASGYAKVSIRADFVLEYWPGDASEAGDSIHQKRAISPIALEKLVRSIIAATPDNLHPFSIDEISTLVRLRMPNCPRTSIRTLITKIRGHLKPGPKSARQPDRKDRFEEFCRNNSAAELHN